MPNPVSRHLKDILKESNQPTDKNNFPEGHPFEFQVPIPGKSHKHIGNNKQDNCSHKKTFINFGCKFMKVFEEYVLQKALFQSKFFNNNIGFFIKRFYCFTIFRSTCHFGFKPKIKLNLWFSA